jgi:uncharacterized membrane protein YgcG
MINIKKLTALLVTMMIMVVSAVPLSASADTANKDKGYIFDLDDSLSDSQEDALEKQLEELSKKSAMNVAVVISDDLDGKNQVAYADDYYDSLFGINTDGILLLLNNYNQIDHISTSGDRIIKLYDQDYMNHMFDKMSPSLKAGDYDRAIGIFLELAYPSAVSRYNFMNGTVKFAGIGLLAGLLLAVVAVIPSALMFSAIGFLFGTFFNEKAAPGICSIIISLGAMVGGIWFDVEGVGGFMYKLGRCLPFL